MHVPMSLILSTSWIQGTSWLLSAPVPTPTMTVDPETVTPGFAGFVAIAVLAIAVVILVLDRLRRGRRAKSRSQSAEELAAELADPSPTETSPEKE